MKIYLNFLKFVCELPPKFLKFSPTYQMLIHACFKVFINILHENSFFNPFPVIWRWLVFSLTLINCHQSFIPSNTPTRFSKVDWISKSLRQTPSPALVSSSSPAKTKWDGMLSCLSTNLNTRKNLFKQSNAFQDF